jgi:16S rRNA (uracil1498-N3)-methyltransferase
MATPRFYVPEGLAPDARLALAPEASHHARRVLRLRAGEEVVLFDGAGNEYQAVLEAAAPNENRSYVRVLRGGAVDREAALQVTLVQALCAQDKTAWIVEKCVELGVARLILAPAARSVVRLAAARAPRRADRWREIAISACCQCGRNRIPSVELAGDLASALRGAGDGTQRLLLDPAAAAGLPQPQGAGVVLAVGPEGGFTAGELQLAASLGYAATRLGPRVLRTETAGLAAISALLAREGEFS